MVQLGINGVFVSGKIHRNQGNAHAKGMGAVHLSGGMVCAVQGGEL